MILPHNYWYFANALSDQTCESILELGLETMHNARRDYGDTAINGVTGDWKHKQSLGTKTNTTTIDNSTVEDIIKSGNSLDNMHVRDSNVAWLNETWLYNMIWPYVHEANKLSGWNFEWDFTEELQFTKYGVNQFYGWHADSGADKYELFDPTIHKLKLNEDGTPLLTSDGSVIPEASHLISNPSKVGKIRKLSVTISLSDPATYEGGNLKFDLGPHRGDRYHECAEIRPRGSIIVFPSHVYHQVTPVTKGTRYSLVAWNLGYPFK
jgi:PKHD-type hydroxylase